MIRDIVLAAVFVGLIAGLMAGCNRAPAGPTPTEPTEPTMPPLPPDAGLQQLWDDLVFGAHDGPRNDRAWILPQTPERLAAVDVHRPASMNHRDADMEEILNLISMRLFNRRWSGALIDAADDVQPVRGALVVRTDTFEQGGKCGEAVLGAQFFGFIRLAPGNTCGMDDPRIFRAVFAHELGHALGFWHNSDRRGLMAPYLNFEVHRDSLPIADEIRIARCAYEHLTHGSPYQPLPASC